MKVIRVGREDLEAVTTELTVTSSLMDDRITEQTQSIVNEVKKRGDAGLFDLAERFDGADLRSNGLTVSEAEFQAARDACDSALESALQIAHKNVAAFSEEAKRVSWRRENAQGASVGEKFDPFERVGVYIPGGTAPLVSTAIMTLTLAQVAGCEQIAVCTPCAADGSVNPALLRAIEFCGVNEVYKLGGAQAIAALAFGTPSVRPTQKIFGPGNAYVVAAKRLLFGYVAIDLLPGPSELLVIADETAPPEFIAADLIAQAEHGSGHERVWALFTSKKTLEATRASVDSQLNARSRRNQIEEALNANAYLIEVDSMDTAIELANRLAPEHCEVMTADDDTICARIRTAGALLLGPDTPTALGDYVAGPSHVLPTGGAGRSFGGLTVDQFQRRTSVTRSDKDALRKMWPTVNALATLEGLDAHSESVRIRLDA